jgi:hypothetical protein
MSRSIYAWSHARPRKEGYWFYRHDPECEESIVKVFRGAGETQLSYLYGDLDADPEDPDARVDWICNAGDEAEWCEIPLPREP